MANPITTGWVLYRLKGDGAEFMGIYQSREKAVRDVEALKGTGEEEGWQIAGVPFLAWGIVAPGVSSQNGKPTLKLVE